MKVYKLVFEQNIWLTGVKFDITFQMKWIALAPQANVLDGIM